MLKKVVVIVLVMLIGAAGAFGYQLLSRYLEQAPETEDPCIAELRDRIAVLSGQVRDLGSKNESSAVDTDLLAARINELEKRITELQEKQRELAAAKPAAPAASGQAGSSDPAVEQASAPAEAPIRITAEELTRAFKELPEETAQLVRKAIRKEVNRIRKEHEAAAKDPRKQLEQKVKEAVQRITIQLSLTPVQVEQFKGIGARFVDKMLEAAEVANERDDPAYAEAARKEIQLETEREIIEILTPEQVDRLREKDPDGFGKRHPRGF